MLFDKFGYFGTLTLVLTPILLAFLIPISLIFFGDILVALAMLALIYGVIFIIACYFGLLEWIGIV